MLLPLTTEDIVKMLSTVASPVERKAICHQKRACCRGGSWVGSSSSSMSLYTGRRSRGSLARTIYERLLVDEQHKQSNHSYWYTIDRRKLPADVCDRLLQLHQDGETSDFLDNCYEKADWVGTQIYHSLVKVFLSWFMANTSINGWLGRGSMFVFSRSQFEQLLNIPQDWRGKNMLDLGAGDGEVTKKMAPYFNTVYATETSDTMVQKLAQKGYRILDIEGWADGSLQYDLVSCLNLLDRCDKPVSILHSMKRVLAPGGFVVIAVVLPFKPFVEFGTPGNEPTERILVRGISFEEQVTSLIHDVFEPAGFTVLQWTRLPYLCEGDMESSFYVLDDAVFVMKLRENG